MILSAKTFFIPKDGMLSVDEFMGWFNSVNRLRSDCNLIVKLESLGRQKRLNKKYAEDLLRAWYPVYGGAWVKGDYELYFNINRFFWKDKEIYLTVGERFFLYRWLVMKEDIYKQQGYFLKHRRKRSSKGLGKDFLADIKDEKEYQITVERLKRLHECNRVKYSNDQMSRFSGVMMSFSGDTMENFDVRDAGTIKARVKKEITDVEVWELLRKEPTKNKPAGHVAYFRKDNGREILYYDVVEEEQHDGK